MHCQIQPPDTHHLSSAIGWLELGNHLEANADLQKISPLLRGHPDVMEVRWQVYAKAKWWEGCVYIAESILKQAPERSSGWIYRAYSLRRVKGLLAAWMSLLPAADKFPKDWVVAYNLACYCCQLGNLPASREWLKKAFARGEAAKIRQMATDDPDLKPLASEIASL